MQWITDLTAENFRNFIKISAGFGREINIIHGGNAQGKTNLIESIFFCASGRSVRASSERELIRFGCKEAFINLKFKRFDTDNSIDANIKSEPKSFKLFSFNSVPVKKVNELYGRLLVVMFLPDDLKLIKAGPAERRNFMDSEICQLSPVYANELKEYNRALKQRNNLLRNLSPLNEDSLPVWDEQLSKHGSRIMRFRRSFIQQASFAAAEIHHKITSGEELILNYLPNIEEADVFLETLKRNRKVDISTGTTGRGIHKDEVSFLINGIPARSFGSQGQQRTAALSAKLAEIQIIKDNTGELPVLLLDDVLSELDEKRQRFLLEQIGPMQVILTCTGVEDIVRTRAIDGDCRVMRMEKGEII